MRVWTLTGIAAAAVLATSAGSARAAEPAVGISMAQALFEEGTELLSHGVLEAACQKLAESHRLAPAGGTVYNLAVCLERQGKTASAYVAYDEALARATRDGLVEREAMIRERLGVLKPRLVRFVVRPPAPGSRVDVRLDGEQMRPETWNTPMPIDPGTHVVDAQEAGRVFAHEELPLDEPGRLYEWRVPAPSLLVVSPDRHEGPPAPGTTRKRTATVLLVAGGALLVTGAVFGTMALGAHGTSNAQCPLGPSSCTAAGVDAESDAHTYAWGADIGIGAGLIALAAGAVVLLAK